MLGTRLTIEEQEELQFAVDDALREHAHLERMAATISGHDEDAGIVYGALLRRSRRIGVLVAGLRKALAELAS